MSLPFPDNPYGFATNQPILQCHCDIARGCGMRNARYIMQWQNLEPAEGSFDPTHLAILDSVVQLCYANGLNLTLVLDQAPDWANTNTFHNGCTNISPSKALAFVQYLLNRYNGGGIPTAVVARLETNEGYNDKGPGTKCQSFENAVPVLQSLYPWMQANYPDVLLGMPAHFNRKQSDILATHATLYTGFYGSAKGLFHYANYHWYGAVKAGGLYTGPDGPQKTGNDTFNQEWQDIHSVDVANGNGGIPVYCTETGMAVPGGSGGNTEDMKAAFFVGGTIGGITTPGVFQDGLNSGGVLTHVYPWTIENENGYSLTEGCTPWTARPAYTAIQTFTSQVPQWIQYYTRPFGGAIPYQPQYYLPSVGSDYAVSVLNDGPMAYYRLDETFGLVAHDVSGNGYNATITADTTLAQAGLLIGDSDTAMSFTAKGGLSLPVTLSRQISTWTAISIEFWIKVSSVAHYIVATCNDTTTLLYMDGVAYVSGSGDPIVIDSLFTFAGSYDAAVIDEIAIYNKVLSPVTIASRYQIGTSGLAPAPEETLFLPDYFVAATDNQLHQYGPGVLTLDPEGRVTSIGGVS
jgi:hypothetical protein